MPVQEAKKICFERALSFGALTSKGFEDLSLITGGVEALGHDLFVDELSIAGLTKLLMGKTLPGYLTHNGLSGGDRLGQEIGLFSGFYRDGMKVKAKQFSFLKSFKQHEAPLHDKLVELANEVPDQFGLSVVFEGSANWVKQDGSELSADEAMPEGCVRGIPSIRFSAVESADFVKAPAANPDGLLSVDGAKQGMANATSNSLNAITTGGNFTTAVATSGGLTASFVDATVLAAKDAEIVALSASHKTALDALKAEHQTALDKLATDHKAALAAVEADKVKALAEAKTASDAELAKKDGELKAAEAFDIRKTGVSPAVGDVVGRSTETSLPEAGANDSANWEIHSALEAKDKKAAAAFKAKYLSALEKKMVTFTPAG